MAAILGHDKDRTARVKAVVCGNAVGQVGVSETLLFQKVARDEIVKSDFDTVKCHKKCGTVECARGPKSKKVGVAVLTPRNKEGVHSNGWYKSLKNSNGCH
jgi:hypothetical protein